MSKYKRLLLPALLAAGAMLLTACDLGSSADDGKQNTPTTANSTTEDAIGEEGTEDEGDQIGFSSTPPAEGHCGEPTNGDGPTMRMFSDEGSLGYISCDDAGHVLGDFFMLDNQVEIPADGIILDDDWHCDATIDAGVTVAVECYTPAMPDPANPIQLRFHTEPI